LERFSSFFLKRRKKNAEIKHKELFKKNSNIGSNKKIYTNLNSDVFVAKHYG